MLDVDIYQMV